MARGVTHEQIEDIRARTDIVELIGSRLTLKRSGQGFTACCPFHREKTPSFHVNPSRQSYKCFGCGEGGDAFAFLMKHDGMSFGDALRHLAERCGVKLEYGDDGGQDVLRRRLTALHEALATFYHATLKEWPKAAVARDYLAERAIASETVAAFRLGFAPDEEGVMLRWAKAKKFTEQEMVAGGVLSTVERYGKTYFHDRFRGRLMFPICDAQGRVIAFSGRLLQKEAKAAKYVNSPETPLFTKGRTLYALDKAQRPIAQSAGRQAIVCEGQIDVIRCHASGFDTAVASQGTAFTADHVTLLKRYADSVVLAFDSDGAGQKAAIATARHFLAAGIPVRVANLPEGKDPDDFLRSRPREDFAALIDAAEEIIPFQVRYAQAQEQNPSSAAAAGRIAESLVETLRQCANAVHQARMLQEAARLLAVPESALQTQLGKAIEKAKAQEERRAATDEARAEIRQKAAEHHQAQTEADAFLVPVEDEEHLPLDGIEIEGASPAPEAAARMRPEEYALCEILAQHQENAALVTFIAEWAPSKLLAHPHARLVAEAIYHDLREPDGSAFSHLQETAPPDLAPFLAALVTGENRFSHGEASVTDAAKDIILALWRRFLRAEIAALGPADETRRLTLAMDERRLRSWDTAHDVIQKLIVLPHKNTV